MKESADANQHSWLIALTFPAEMVFVRAIRSLSKLKTLPWLRGRFETDEEERFCSSGRPQMS